MLIKYAVQKDFHPIKLRTSLDKMGGGGGRVDSVNESVTSEKPLLVIIISLIYISVKRKGNLFYQQTWSANDVESCCIPCAVGVFYVISVPI